MNKETSVKKLLYHLAGSELSSDTFLIALFLFEHPDGLLLKDIVEITGLTRHQVSRIINAYSKDGYRLNGRPNHRPVIFRIKELAGKAGSTAGRPRKVMLNANGRKMVQRLLNQA